MSQQTTTAKQTSLFDTDMPTTAPQLPQDEPSAPPPPPMPPEAERRSYDWLAEYVAGRR